MKRIFQPIDFRKDDYNRPHDKWVCGRAKDGCACPLGPDRQGVCRATAECIPVKKGDRWHCSRTDKRGGKCQDGPLSDGRCCNEIEPCIPSRSLRSLRGATTLLVGLITLGVLLTLLFLPGHDLVDPGELSVAHAAIESQCSQCHDMSKESHPIVTGIEGMEQIKLNESQLCLNCHDLGAHALVAHGVSQGRLLKLRHQAQDMPGYVDEAPLLVKLMTNDRVAEQGLLGELPCSTCHGEHHGRDFELTTMTDHQCQVCHIEQFDSFNKGHPEFRSYPFKRRTRIKFDHVSHFGEHFVNAQYEERAPRTCVSCHVPDNQGASMLVRGFENTCASCHESQIMGDGRAGEKGIAFFKLPGIDTLSLEEKGYTVGQWPEYAEGEITPYMQFLIEERYLSADQMKRIRELDTLDLQDASEDDLKTVEDYGWAVKQLMFDLIVKGHEFLLSSIENNSDVDLAEGTDPRSLTASLPQDILLAAKNEWMPQLLDEVPNYRVGIKPKLATAEDEDMASTEPSPKDASSPSLGDTDGDLLGGDEDDGDLLGGDDDDGDLLGGDDDGDLLGDSMDDSDGGLLGDDEDDGGLLGDDDSDDDGGLLGDDDSDGGLLGDDDDSGDLLGGDDDSGLLGDSMDDDGGLELSDSTDTPAQPKAPEIEWMSQEEWMMAGGWYRNDVSYSLHYRPTGHADTFLTSWVDTTSHFLLSKKETVGKAIFNELMADKSIGLCAKCHSVDEIKPTERDLRPHIEVNWNASRPQLKVHSFTPFNHKPHFSVFADIGCASCHEINKRTTSSETYDSLDPFTFSSNFKPLEKANCTECHTPEVAGESCLQCHNYHTGSFASSLAERIADIRGVFAASSDEEEEDETIEEVTEPTE